MAFESLRKGPEPVKGGQAIYQLPFTLELLSQAYFFTTFPANPANGFAGTLSYFDFVELFWPKCLSYFAKMLELFSENA